MVLVRRPRVTAKILRAKRPCGSEVVTKDDLGPRTFRVEDEYGTKTCSTLHPNPLAGSRSRGTVCGLDLQTALACISHHLTAEARNRPAITSLRLRAVLNVLSEYASLIQWGSSSGARLVLTGLSRTSPRHLVRNAG